MSAGPSEATREDRRIVFERTYEEYDRPAAARERLVSALETAERSVLLMTNVTDLPVVVPALRKARDRDALVLLLVTGTNESDLATADLSSAATVVRFWDTGEIPMTMAAVDDDWGMAAAMELSGDGGGRGVAFSDALLHNLVVATVLGNLWTGSRQLLTGDPSSLPRRYTSFYHAVVDATLYLGDGTPIEVVAEGFPVDDPDRTTTVEGRVVTVRQGFVSPMTNSFPSENALVLETPDAGRVTVGGSGSIVEDFEAAAVELRPIER